MNLDADFAGIVRSLRNFPISLRKIALAEQWGYAYGMYRPTQGGMMQSNTGEFNAPSRHAIYHRIIIESEGPSAYSWNKFLEYDKINR